MRTRALGRAGLTTLVALLGSGMLGSVVPAHAGSVTGSGVACSGDPNTVLPLSIIVEGQTATGRYALPNGAPKGLVVFSHGHGRTSDSWTAQVKEMAVRDGVIALAMDYRGQVNDAAPGPDGITHSFGWRVAEGAEDGIAAAQLFERTCHAALATAPIVDYGVSMGGNTSGLIAATAARRSDGTTPLFDWWFDIEGVTNLTEEYLIARGVAPVNSSGRVAQTEIEQEAGGALEQRPERYRQLSVVTRAEDIKAAGIRGAVMVHAAADGLVPYDQTRQMAARLDQVGVPTHVFTVATRGDDGETDETTLDRDALGAVKPDYTSPFAGHASESSPTARVARLGLERLHALLEHSDSCASPAAHREFVADGTLGSPPPMVVPPTTAC